MNAARVGGVGKSRMVVSCGLPVLALVMSGCENSAGFKPDREEHTPPSLKCSGDSPSVTCEFKGDVDGREFVYYEGVFTKSPPLGFRVVIGSMGEEEILGDGGKLIGYKKIGVPVPQAALNASGGAVHMALDGDKQSGEQEASTAIVCVQDGRQRYYKLAIKSGFAAMEVFPIDPALVDEAGSTAGGVQNFGARTYLLPIPWRFITTDGIRTGANSSRYFFAAVPGTRADLLCYSDKGEVIAWPDEKNPNDPNPEPTNPKTTGLLGVWKLGRYIPKTSMPSKVIQEPTSPNDQDQFMNEARQFLMRATKVHDEAHTH